MLSDPLGNYAFPALRPATYHVRQIVPAGFEQTFPLNNGTHTVTIVNRGTSVPVGGS